MDPLANIALTRLFTDLGSEADNQVGLEPRSLSKIEVARAMLAGRGCVVCLTSLRFKGGGGDWGAAEIGCGGTRLGVARGGYCCAFWGGGRM